MQLKDYLTAMVRLMFAHRALKSATACWRGETRGNVPGFLLVRAEQLNVRYWHKADMLIAARNVCFRG